MKNKAVLMAFVSVLLLSAAFRALFITPVRAGGTIIYVDASNVDDPLEDGSLEHPFDKIQEGIDAASPGDTVQVAAGTYYENIVIGKSINLIGENKENTIINAGGAVAVTNEYYGDWVNMSRFTVTNGYYGIYLYNVSNNLMKDCIICNFSWGILPIGRGHHTIKNCIIYNNERGIWVAASENKIENCIIYNNTDEGAGIWVHSGSKNNIINCTVKNNAGKAGIYAYGARITREKFFFSDFLFCERLFETVDFRSFFVLNHFLDSL